MGKAQSRKATTVQTAWLPGFEPSNQADSPRRVEQGEEAFEPTATPVAMVTSAVVEIALGPILGPIQAAANQEDIATVDPETASAGQWPAFDANRLMPPQGLQERIVANLDAVRYLRELREGTAQLTDEGRHKLLAYSGWGSAARLFEKLPNNSLEPHRLTLESLVSEAEYASARSSVTSAYYTDPSVVKAMWSMVRQLGFRGGRVIEPAAGTGLFLAGMPREIAPLCEITAVEPDQLSASILEQAFSGLGVVVHKACIEKAPLPHGHWDLVIGNVPFGQHKSLETAAVAYSEWSLHNYFFGKALDLVRPGGLVVLITSSFTMDSAGSAHREWINANAELLGAYRLPNTAFKRNASTEVVTDILVLKKRAAPHFNATHAWLKVTTAPDSLIRQGQPTFEWQGYGGKSWKVEHKREINEYYARNHHAVVGDLVLESSQYGKRFTTAFDGTEQQFADRLTSLAATLPADVYEPRATGKDEQAPNVFLRVQATQAVKPGAFVVQDGRICVAETELQWIDVDDAYQGKVRERMLGMIGLRTTARKLLAAQVEEGAEARFTELQHALNVQYDQFVKSCGFISQSTNVRVFRSDPDCPLLLSLECYDEDADTFRKADIFSKRTAGRTVVPEVAETVPDAMAISLGLYGRIHVDDMAKRLGKPASRVREALREEGLAYVDPKTGNWQTADEYLSGNIREKIAIAAAAGKRFAGNVLALTQVIPEPLGPADVEVRLGAPWVPSDIIAAFGKHLLEEDVPVAYCNASATWSVLVEKHQRDWFGNRTKNLVEWGTKKRPAIELLEAALNNVPPKVMMTNHQRKQVVDKPGTLAAREKYEKIRAEFRTWAYADDARAERLLSIYNSQFNQIVERRYNGSHLMLHGMSQVIEPYQSQLDAIWRIVSSGNTLLAHAVGAGKTFIMVASAMEMRRIGKANKPLMVVPNHLLYQITGDAVRFYPNARVLMATKEDFEGDKRREFVARVATGDYDLVIMTQSTFERVPLRPEEQQAFIDEQLQTLRYGLTEAREKGGWRTVKQCEAILKAFEAKMERAKNDRAKDDLVSFSELGVDYCMYDEAHALKNMLRVSKMPPIAGISSATSNRAFDAWMKTGLIMKMRGDKEQGVCLATATPIANSCADLFSFQKLLQPMTLKALGLSEFDAWSATFGEAVTGMEVAPDGSGFRLNTRYARFVNVSELMAIFGQVADIRTRQQLKLPTPAIKTGKPIVVEAESSAQLREFTDSLVERAQAIRNGGVKPTEDNMLLVTTAGRKAALDMRLVDPMAAFDPNGKVAKCVQNVVRIWTETLEQKGTQIVFCDLSTPKSEGFSVYQDLRSRFIEAGIPDAQIAFIHDYATDAAKDRLFREVRAGRIRVLLGSTPMLGVGTNVQTRLRAIHQLDTPWRPCDVEQRDGRGLRQGNMWSEIELIRYVTLNSFDAYSWQILEMKARFIEQVMTAGKGLRTIEDVSMGALTFAEIKAIASGNPVVLEKATVDAEVTKYSLLRNAWEQAKWEMRNRMGSNEFSIQKMQRSLPILQAHAREIAEQASTGLVFTTGRDRATGSRSGGGLEYAIGAEVLARSKECREPGTYLVGSVAGMDLVITRGVSVGLGLQSPKAHGLEFTLNRRGVQLSDPIQTGQFIVDQVKSLVDEPKAWSTRIVAMEAENADMRDLLAKPYEHEEKLRALIERQVAIEATLDLDKDDAGAEDASAVSAE